MLCIHRTRMHPYIRIHIFLSPFKMEERGRMELVEGHMAAIHDMVLGTES